MIKKIYWKIFFSGVRLSLKKFNNIQKNKCHLLIDSDDALNKDL